MISYMDKKMPCFEIDNDGFVIESYFLTEEEIYDEIFNGKKMIFKGWEESFYKPKFDIEQNIWLEGLSKEEIDILQENNKPQIGEMEILRKENEELKMRLLTNEKDTEINAMALMELTQIIFGGGI